MNKECQTGRELDCPNYSICEYNANDRLISNIDPLKLKSSWEFEGRNYSCQKREVELISLLEQ